MIHRRQKKYILLFCFLCYNTLVFSSESVFSGEIYFPDDTIKHSTESAQAKQLVTYRLDTVKRWNVGEDGVMWYISDSLLVQTHKSVTHVWKPHPVMSFQRDRLGNRYWIKGNVRVREKKGTLSFWQQINNVKQEMTGENKYMVFSPSLEVEVADQPLVIWRILEEVPQKDFGNLSMWYIADSLCVGRVGGELQIWKPSSTYDFHEGFEMESYNQLKDSLYYQGEQKAHELLSQKSIKELINKYLPPPLPVKPNYWQNKTNISVKITQLHYENWAKGDKGSISALANVDADFKYIRKKISWENMLDISNGFLVPEDESIRKTQDKFKFESKFGLYAFKKWTYSMYTSVESQFFKGYTYPNDSVYISDFMAPGVIQVGVGLDYKPRSNISLVLAPFTAKMTIVNDSSTTIKDKYNVEEGEIFRLEKGGSINSQVNFNLFKTMQLKNSVTFFINYIEKTENIDVNWELSLKYKISKYISAALDFLLIYDDDVIQKTQIKETFSIGLDFDL